MVPGRNLLIRCDASSELGLGHLGRSLALAEELGERLGVRPTFLSHPDPLLEHFLRGRTAEVRAVAGPGYALDAVLSEVSPGDLLVSDSYELDDAALRAIAEIGLRHVVIDDFARLQTWEGAMIVNPNLGAERHAYPGASMVLAGSRYALLRREVRSAFERREPLRTAGTRLLVCLGGGAWGPTGRSLLEGLAELIQEGIEVHAATSGTVPDGIQAVPQRRLMDELAWADAGLLSGGVLKYEAAAAGLPSVLLAVVPHQRPVAKALARAGAAIYVGSLSDVDPRTVSRTVQALLSDPAVRAAISDAAHALIDGLGAQRVADAVLGERVAEQSAGEVVTPGLDEKRR